MQAVPTEDVTLCFSALISREMLNSVNTMNFSLFNLGPVKQRDCGAADDLRQQEWAVLWLGGRR